MKSYRHHIIQRSSQPKCISAAADSRSSVCYVMLPRQVGVCVPDHWHRSACQSLIGDNGASKSFFGIREWYECQMKPFKMNIRTYTHRRVENNEHHAETILVWKECWAAHAVKPWQCVCAAHFMTRGHRVRPWAKQTDSITHQVHLSR